VRATKLVSVQRRHTDIKEGTECQSMLCMLYDKVGES
jgi:hypothetical protein